MSLLDMNGRPILGDVKRQEMKSGQVKKTIYGDIIFKLTIDTPKEMPEDTLRAAVREYGHIIKEAFHDG